MLVANLPSLGAKALGEIDAPDVVAMARLIDSRGTSETAKRVLETAGHIFRCGIAH